MRLSSYTVVVGSWVIAASLLAGCGTFSPTTQQPTAVPTTASDTTQPTTVSATSAPTAVPGSTSQPTAAASTPVIRDDVPTAVPVSAPAIDFQPRGGPANTSITLRGWGFKPNSRIAVRIGLPQAVGEVLSTLETDAAGAGSVQVIIPGVLPSGEPIYTTSMRIVAMDDQNTPLASAPFAFEPDRPGEAHPVYGTAQNAKQATKYFLDALLEYPHGYEPLMYVTPELAKAHANGSAYNILLIEKPFHSYTINGVVASGGHGTQVEVVLDTGTRLHVSAIPYTDTIWLVNGAQVMSVDELPDAADIAKAEAVARHYFEAMGADRSAEAWALQTPDLQAAISEETVRTNGRQVVSSLVTAATVSNLGDHQVTLRLTVDMVLEPTAPASLGGGLRDFELVMGEMADGQWRVHHVTSL